MVEGVHYGLEQALCEPFAMPGPRDLARFHDWLRAHNDEQPAADPQRAFEARIVDRQRSRQRNDVVLAVRGDRHRVHDLDRDVVSRSAPEICSRGLRKRGTDFETRHRSCAKPVRVTCADARSSPRQDLTG